MSVRAIVDFRCLWSRAWHLLAVLLLIVTCHLAYASLPFVTLEGWTSHTWNIADGLPDQSIEAIAQTPDGYLWLGTPHGLARYDGTNFEVRANGSRTILQEFGVSCLLVSKDGDLWVGSVGGGITRISHNHTDYSYEAGSEGLTVRALYQDEGGTIWAATGHGLYRLSHDRFVFETEVGDQILTLIAPDGSGGLWLAGVSLLHLSHGHVHEMERPYSDKDAVIHGLVVTNHQVWVGTPYGLFETDGQHALKRVPEVKSGVRALYSDSRGILWIATVEDGIITRKPDGSFYQASDTVDPISKAVRILTETSNGDIWAGTTAGLIRMSNSGMNLFPISTTAGSDFGSIFVDRDGAVWLSAGRLTRFGNGTEKEAQFPRARDVPIRAFFRDSSGAVWIGTLGDGCYRYSDHGSQHLTMAAAIRGFLEGDDGVVWIASDAGISKWQQGVWTTIEDSPGTPHGAVRAMALSGGALWVGTSEGLYLVRNGRKENTGLSQLIGHQRIWALHAGKGNSLWIGTESGLYVWQDKSLVRLTFPLEDIQTRAVLSILQDTQGRVLIAQPGTILRVSQADLDNAIQGAKKASSAVIDSQVNGTPEVFNIAKETGAELYGTIPFTAQVDRTGGAWYASYLGLVHIGSASSNRNEEPPHVVIEKVSVDGVTMQSGTPLKLSSSARNLQIQVAPILLSSRPGLQLRSRLIGAEGGWTELLPNATSIYTKLPPGRYTYRAEANWVGQSKRSFVELELIQEGPYYRKPWFVALVCAVLVLLGWLFYQFKVHQLQLQFRAVTTERSRVAREIHDTVLQGCIAVYSLLDAHMTTQEEPEETERLDDSQDSLLHHARKQIVETISEARTAIWNVRQSETEESLNNQLQDLIKRLVSRSHVAGLFESEGEPVKLSPAIQYEVLMATREAILNALSHASPQRIVVRVTRGLRDRVFVEIVDDGSGFDATVDRADDPQHFGLAGLEERLSGIRGACTIKSAPGEGTRVSLEIPHH